MGAWEWLVTAHTSQGFSTSLSNARGDLAWLHMRQRTPLIAPARSGTLLMQCPSLMQGTGAFGHFSPLQGTGIRGTNLSAAVVFLPKLE